jgi:hypothetical protein
VRRILIHPGAAASLLLAVRCAPPPGTTLVRPPDPLPLPFRDNEKIRAAEAKACPPSGEEESVRIHPVHVWVVRALGAGCLACLAAWLTR